MASNQEAVLCATNRQNLRSIRKFLMATEILNGHEEHEEHEETQRPQRITAFVTFCVSCG
jgi:hypothetical protein